MKLLIEFYIIMPSEIISKRIIAFYSLFPKIIFEKRENVNVFRKENKMKVGNNDALLLGKYSHTTKNYKTT